MLIFQYHCISHQGTMFGFHGQGTFTSSSAYVLAWDQLPESSQITENTNVCTEEDKYSDIIYLDDILIMSQTLEEIFMSRDTVIFLLQLLDFVLKMEKSILSPIQEIGFLGVTINSLKMCLSLPQ